MRSHLTIFWPTMSTSPSYTLPPGAMTTTSAMRTGRGADAGSTSQAVISTLRGSWRDTTLKNTSPWHFLTSAITDSISAPVNGSNGCGGAVGGAIVSFQTLERQRGQLNEEEGKVHRAPSPIKHVGASFLDDADLFPGSTPHCTSTTSESSPTRPKPRHGFTRSCIGKHCHWLGETN
jgi:hypothetical protein